MFNMNLELMCPDDEVVGTILKFANAGEASNEKAWRYAIEGVRRARTEEVENNAQHYSNEQDEVCNETLSNFNVVLSSLFNACLFVGTKSIRGIITKN